MKQEETLKEDPEIIKEKLAEETTEKETAQETKAENNNDNQKNKKQADQKNNAQNQKTTEQAKPEPIDYKDKYIRTLAEMENLRKRLQKEKLETISYVVENTISEFLPVLDNFENALKFASSSSEEIKKWASGFQMIITQFRDVLYSHGIVAFHSEGNHFDPHFHEAMEIVETNEHSDGTILEEFSKGYKSENRVIRPAKVKVAKKPFVKEDLKTNNQGQNNE